MRNAPPGIHAMPECGGLLGVGAGWLRSSAMFRFILNLGDSPDMDRRSKQGKRAIWDAESLPESAGSEVERGSGLPAGYRCRQREGTILRPREERLEA